MNLQSNTIRIGSNIHSLSDIETKSAKMTSRNAKTLTCFMFVFTSVIFLAVNAKPSSDFTGNYNATAFNLQEQHNNELMNETHIQLQSQILTKQNKYHLLNEAQVSPSNGTYIENARSVKKPQNKIVRE